MTLTPNDYERGINDGWKEAVPATIERCAQVAENYAKVCQALPGSSIDSVCRGIAAAIRAQLKDQPPATTATCHDPNLQYPGKDPDFVFPEE